MRYTSDAERREAFAARLRAELERLDFYMRHGDRYFIAEFCRWAQKEHGVRLDEVSMGRYLRRHNPVLPIPEVCSDLARVLGRSGLEIKMWAGYVVPEDFPEVPGDGRTRKIEQLLREMEQ